MSNEDDQQKAEELLQQSGQQRRHETEPSASEREGDLKAAIKDALEDIENGDRHSNVTFRDDRYAALFAALSETGHLAGLSEQALDRLDQDDVDGDLNARATAIKLLVKIGLEEVDAGLIETFEQAAREHVQESSDFSL